MKLPRKKEKKSPTTTMYKLGTGGHKNRKKLEDMPMPVLDTLVQYLDNKSVINMRHMCRKIRVAASKRLWEHVTLTNLPQKRQEKNKLQIYINKHTFRTFFEDLYAGKLDYQLSCTKKFELLFKEENLVDLSAGTTVDTVKNLNYVPIQNFFHWFLDTKGDLMQNVEKVQMSINIGTTAFADAIRQFSWSLPKARVGVTYWIPGFAGIMAKDMIAPNMHEIEIKCDLLNFDTKIFNGDFCLPRKCQVFRLRLEDKLRFEHGLNLKVAAVRPKLSAEQLTKWFRKCQNLATLELNHVDIYNSDAIDWTPECFASIKQPTCLTLEEVEFHPPKQAVIMKHVNLLDRINIVTRPLMELLAPHLLSLSVAATKASEEQLVQLVHWFKFHKPTLQKISLEHMTFSQLDYLLKNLAVERYKMIDIIEPIPDSRLRFQDLAKNCNYFAVLKIHMKNISIEQATNFLKYIYETPNVLSSVRVVDGPFSKNTLPKFVLTDSRQFQLLETKYSTLMHNYSNSKKRCLVFEKPSSMPTSPTSSLTTRSSRSSFGSLDSIASK